jgi:tetratricopeptide (TPR) repeat protein
MVALFGLAACVLSASPLAPAEQAFAAKRYEQVLPALERARKAPLTREEQVRGDALEAMTHAAFDESEKAIEAFRKALQLEPDFQVDARASPKIRGLFAEALRRERLVHPRLNEPTANPTVVFVPAPEQAAPASPPVWKRWWFWTAAGVVVAGASAAVWYGAQPKFPEGSLGKDELP